MTKGTRGGNFYASFLANQTLTTLDALVYIAGSNTVDTMPVSVGTYAPIGTLVQKSVGGTFTTCGVDLFWPTRKGIAGASITAGQRLTVQSSTGYLIPVAGTLTAVPVVGVAVGGGGGSGVKIEFVPQYYNGIVLV